MSKATQLVARLTEDWGDPEPKVDPNWLRVFKAQGASDEWVKDYQHSLPAYYLGGERYYVDYDQMLATPEDWDQPAYWFGEMDFDQMSEWLDDKSGVGGAEVDAERHVYSFFEPPPDAPEISLEQKRPHVVFEHGNFVVLKMPADEAFIRREGIDMQHCLSVAYREYCQRLREGAQEQYSLVDIRDGKPRVDMEVALSKGSYSRDEIKKPCITQIRGIRNQCPPADEYLPTIVAFLTEYGGPKGWVIGGHNIRNFDGGVDGDKVLKRWEELQGGPQQEGLEDDPSDSALDRLLGRRKNLIKGHQLTDASYGCSIYFQCSCGWNASSAAWEEEAPAKKAELYALWREHVDRDAHFDHIQHMARRRMGIKEAKQGEFWTPEELGDDEGPISNELLQHYISQLNTWRFDKNRRIRISYSITTPESAEQGDYAEHGWEDEEGVSMEPDEFDRDDGKTALELTLEFFNKKGISEASSSHFHEGIWYTSQEHDYHTGEDKEYNYHLVNFSPEEEEMVWKAWKRYDETHI
jgi:hypothetical protein